LNERQIKLLNRLQDSFDGKLTSTKWATITKCSPDTALRDITELLALGALRKSEAEGVVRRMSWPIDQRARRTNRKTQLNAYIRVFV
jgi:Fic family protein